MRPRHFWRTIMRCEWHFARVQFTYIDIFPYQTPGATPGAQLHVLAYAAQLHCCFWMTLWVTWWHHQMNVHVTKLRLSGHALVLQKSAQTKISKLQQAQAKLERLRRRRPSLLLANNKSEQTIPCSRLPNCVLMLYSPLKALLSKQDTDNKAWQSWHFLI